jgi:hypothetical protein
MARIGEFEAAARVVDPNVELDTFGFCGQEFTIEPEINLVAIGRFQKVANAGGDTDDPDALPLLIDTIASCVIEADEKRFLDLASKRRVDAELLLKIVGAVMEVQAGRPTARPTDSSDGSSKTTPSSREPSSSAAPSAPKTWRDTPFGKRELAAHPELYEGIGSMAENGRALSSAG